MIYNIVAEKIIMPFSDKVLQTELWNTFLRWKWIQHKDADWMHNEQMRLLRHTLDFAKEHVDYYKNMNIPYEEDPRKYLAHFPILTKEILKEKNLLSVNSVEGLVKRSSSGSSGVQSTVYMTKTEVSRVSAIQALWWSWAGYRFGNKVLQAGINPNRGVVKRLKDILLRFKYINAFSLSDEDILMILEDLKRNPRQHLIGYASSLYSMAMVARKYNINGVTFTSVMSLGDKMFSHYRKVIEEEFKTKVFDTYGCSEGLMMAGECEYNKYHIMSPHIYMEIVDDDGHEVEAGQIGHVLITRLDAKAMPIIRYKLGDLAIKAGENERCECGRNFPLVEKIVGRETDLIQLPSGKFVTVHSFTGIFEYFPELKQFQIIETEHGIIVRYIKDAGFTPDIIERIREQIHLKIDGSIKIIFIEESVIEATASGKPCMVMSKDNAKSYLENIGLKYE